MGLNYSIEIYYPIKALPAALSALPIFAMPSEKPVKIVLPSGAQVELPINGEVENFTLTNGSEIRLMTVLLFPADAALEAYSGLEGRIVRNGEVCYPVGYIDLTITCGIKFAQMSFWCVTSDMSRLFLNSGAVRQRFVDFMQLTGGVLGLINTEKLTYHMLENIALPLTPNDVFETSATLFPMLGDHSLMDIDVVAANLLKVYAYQQRHWKKQHAIPAFHQTWVAPLQPLFDPYKLDFIYRLSKTQRRKLLNHLKKQSPDLRAPIVDLLIQDMDWQYQSIGALWAGLTRDASQTRALGLRLMMYPYQAHLFCWALARIGTPEARQFLVSYLEKYLHADWIDTETRCWDDLTVDWCLACLLWLDEQQGTQDAARFTAPDGLWQTFIQQGIAKITDELEQDYGDLLDRERINWAKRWSIKRARRQLKRVMLFAERFDASSLL